MAVADTVVQAARQALADALADDDRVVVLGEDVVSGGPFTLTRDLSDRFGIERVRNTPISEGAFMGAGVGLALAGGRPFVDIMFDDFVTAASDQLFNHAAKIHFMSGGRRSVPLTVWTLAGADKRWGAQHSQNLASWFGQIPGLKVLCPASPDMMRSSVKAAIEDPDPVILLVDRSLLFSRAGLQGDGGSPWSPRIVRAGDHVTVVSAGRGVHMALEAAGRAQASVEVIDLQRLAPLDLTLVFDSVERTSHLVVAHDEAVPGLTAQVAGAAVEKSFWNLDAPVRCVTSAPTPVPGSGPLEDAHQLTPDDILDALEATLR